MNRRLRLLVFAIMMTSGLVLTHRHVPPTRAQTEQTCFDETGYCIAGRIREFWHENGGLLVFGLPISPQQEAIIAGHPYQVQWFERVRLELHPEHEPPYDVLPGRLGVPLLDQAIAEGKIAGIPTTIEEPQEGCIRFETGWNVCGDILDTFTANGLEKDGEPGLSVDEHVALYGLPLTPLLAMDIEGKTYQVQWFERARFELHPELDPPYHVLTGLLGRAAYHQQHR